MVQWTTPPEQVKAGRRTEYRVEQAQLRDRPGEWAMIREYESYPGAYYLAGKINGGGDPWGPAGTWEAVARRLDGLPQRGGVWARYCTREPDTQEDHSPPG